ncbi:MAG: isocitrate lyase/PEP mutase family protein [Burkholderiales bacterium]
MDEMRSFTQRRQRLRSLLDGPVCLSPATVYDALSARVAQSVGYEIGLLSGSVSGATLLSVPDLALQTLTEFADQVRRIARATDLSLVVDADHGYGNALNVMRTVQELEHAGVAALMIEDLALPARFGATRSELVPTEEMVGKLRAALHARSDPALYIMARTAALKAEDAASGAARARAYAAAGVDAIYVTGLKRLEDFETIRNAVTLPIVVGTAPALRRQDLEARGVRLLLQGHQPVAAVVKALRETYAVRYDGAPLSALESRLASPDELARLMNTATYEEWRRQYLS